MRFADHPPINTWGAGRAKFTLINKKGGAHESGVRDVPRNAGCGVQPLRAAAVYLSSQLAKQPSLGHLPIALSGFRRNS